MLGRSNQVDPQRSGMLRVCAIDPFDRVAVFLRHDLAFETELGRQFAGFDAPFRGQQFEFLDLLDMPEIFVVGIDRLAIERKDAGVADQHFIRSR